MVACNDGPPLRAADSCVARLQAASDGRGCTRMSWRRPHELTENLQFARSSTARSGRLAASNWHRPLHLPLARWNLLSSTAWVHMARNLWDPRHCQLIGSLVEFRCIAFSWLFNPRRQALTLLAHHQAPPALPNVRGEAGPTVGRQARTADDNQGCWAGLVAHRWASPRPRG